MELRTLSLSGLPLRTEYEVPRVPRAENRNNLLPFPPPRRGISRVAGNRIHTAYISQNLCQKWPFMGGHTVPCADPNRRMQRNPVGVTIISIKPNSNCTCLLGIVILSVFYGPWPLKKKKEAIYDRTSLTQSSFFTLLLLLYS